MKIEMMMIGAILFSLVIVLGTGIYGQMLSNYNVSVDTSNTFGKLSYTAKDLYQYDSNMRSNIQGGAVTDANAVDEMLEGGYSAVKTNPFGALGVAANSTEILLKEKDMIPAPAIAFILLTLSILTTFAIIALIFKFEQR